MVTLIAVACGVAIGGCSFQGSVTASGPSGPPLSSAAGHRTSGAGAAGSSSGITHPVTPSAAPGPTSASASGPDRSGSSGGSAPGQGADRCHSGDLEGRLSPGDSSAGHRHAKVVLRNISGHTCRIYGYGGVQLIDQYGQALTTHQARVPSPPPTTVTLPPGGSASSQLTWSAIPGSGDASSGSCQPTPDALAVIPPDETQSLSVSWGFGPVCEQGRLDQQAYVAG